MYDIWCFVFCPFFFWWFWTIFLYFWLFNRFFIFWFFYFWQFFYFWNWKWLNWTFKKMFWQWDFFLRWIFFWWLIFIFFFWHFFFLYKNPFVFRIWWPRWTVNEVYSPPSWIMIDYLIIKWSSISLLFSFSISIKNNN